MQPEEETLPRAFGHYLLFDHIGRGGMADIYLASARTELGAARRMVVKRILRRFSEDPAFSDMLVHEAKLAAKLRHANIVQVFDLGREADSLFIAMEYVEGFDLNQLLSRLTKAKLPLPAEFALLVLRETLRALDYAHRARDEAGRPLGLVHRDISPSNVLISFEGEVKLCDFGIARALEVESSGAPDEETVGRARVAGKWAYMAPEHARGESIDARADVFAAGILGWELIAGRRLYRGNEEEMRALARKGEVPPLPDRGLPDQARLGRLLERALAPERDARHASAGEMLRELEAYAADSGLLASPLRFGEFLTEHFAKEIVDARRDREEVAHRVAAALEKGPLVVLTPIPEVWAVRDTDPDTTPRGARPSAADPDRGYTPAFFVKLALAAAALGLAAYVLVRLTIS